MSKKNLLLCLDAFGTLFKPRYPIAQQYGDVARQLGLTDITDDAVEASFKKAYKAESKEHPNFGKAVGMDSEGWWTNIIHNTFAPLVPPGTELPKELAPRLLHRFWSQEGYAILPDVKAFLRSLPGRSNDVAGDVAGYPGRVVVGVITNSDDRVPFILESLGLSVSWLRYTNLRASRAQDRALRGAHDVDFVIMSYDVGHEKPDNRIFGAAEGILEAILPIEDGFEGMKSALDEWDKVYIGDEYAKDVVGAVNAGWNAVLIDRENPGNEKNVQWPEKPGPSHHSQGIQSLFINGCTAVGFDSLESLGNWLPKKP